LIEHFFEIPNLFILYTDHCQCLCFCISSLLNLSLLF
jgi:hypothetical protein